VKSHSNIYDMCGGVTVATVMLLRDFGHHGIIFMILCVLLQIPLFLAGSF
jgi:hypothetical protein